MKLSEKQRKFSHLVAHIIDFIHLCDYEVTLGEVLRSKEQQAIHVKNGVSRVRFSRHQEKLAIDLNLFFDGKYCTDKEKYRIIGEEWERIGGRWGGRFGVAKEDYETKVGWDAGHFEYGG